MMGAIRVKESVNYVGQRWYPDGLISSHPGNSSDLVSEWSDPEPRLLAYIGSGLSVVRYFKEGRDGSTTILTTLLADQGL